MKVLTKYPSLSILDLCLEISIFTGIKGVGFTAKISHFRELHPSFYHRLNFSSWSTQSIGPILKLPTTLPYSDPYYQADCTPFKSTRDMCRQLKYL